MLKLYCLNHKYARVKYFTITFSNDCQSQLRDDYKIMLNFWLQWISLNTLHNFQVVGEKYNYLRWCFKGSQLQVDSSVLNVLMVSHIRTSKTFLFVYV